MSITNPNATYLTAGPTVSGQILASSPASDTEVALQYKATVTLDGSLTTFTLNFIDGTKTLSFTPSAVTVAVAGGTQPIAAYVGAIAGVPTTTGVPIYLSGAGTNANTLVLVGNIYR